MFAFSLFLYPWYAETNTSDDRTVLTLFQVWKLQMPHRRKLAVLAIFMLGAFWVLLFPQQLNA